MRRNKRERVGEREITRKERKKERGKRCKIKVLDAGKK
jgi:hypothetical protein